MDKYINYVNIDDKMELIVEDEEGVFRYSARYKKTYEKNIILSIPTSKEKKFDYRNGKEMTAFLYTKGGIFKLNVILGYLYKDSCSVVLIENKERIQRRQYIRVPLHIKYKLRLFCEYGSDTIEGNAKNISGKGLNANLRKDISNYPKIEATLFFEEKKITTMARIVKIREVSNKGTRFYNTSFEFLTINEKEIDFIVKKCFEYEILERKKLLNS